MKRSYPDQQPEPFSQGRGGHQITGASALSPISAGEGSWGIRFPPIVISETPDPYRDAERAERALVAFFDKHLKKK
ncbi:hypothetical protein FTUN_7861 [Frigoriglobus tundricola]|uniref:Uncharacterized protein n=1 Tax=Frigoriglobus tundricola TaxID=2774151 RepID=A0A6M5Z3B4_9BACT|nr:hypothetical protein FTUN_7861 [Frigoriglobus tundricola]